MRATILLVLCCTSMLIAQPFAPPPPQSTDTTLKPLPESWKQSLVTALTITQQSYSDWAQGGQDALAYNVSFDGRSTYTSGPINWSTAYKFAFGQTRLGGAEIRKTDDRIDFETVLTYLVSNYVNPYVATSLKTQFASGFKYDKGGTATPISKFFDPGYVTESLGAGYQFLPEIRTRLGVALRQIVTSDFFALYADDPKTTQHERVKYEDGFESVTDVQWALESNVLFTSKLEAFASIRPGDKVVLRGDNTVTTKVGRYVTLVLNFQFINDRVVNPHTQFKETMAIGLSYTLF